ncbi:MAG: hypothetical protein J0M08_06970 [Bacteroidetes bacterium]|nr:hypothetical protein [Bacteroidota bacterium]
MKVFKDRGELLTAIDNTVEQYNNRPKQIHFANTPLEVLGGVEIDFAEMRQNNEQARKDRLEENRNFKCLKMIYTTFHKE